MAIDPEDDAVAALRKVAGEAEIAVIRSCSVQEKNTGDELPTEEQGNLSQVEINYV